MGLLGLVHLNLMEIQLLRQKFLMYFQNRKARQIRKQNTRCSFRPRVCVCVCVFCTGGCVVVVTMHSLFCSRCCCTQSFSSFVCVCVYLFVCRHRRRLLLLFLLYDAFFVCSREREREGGDIGCLFVFVYEEALVYFLLENMIKNYY